MGLEYGYNEAKNKWYAKGLWFIKWYDSKEEMEYDRMNAQDEYFLKRRIFNSFIYAFADLRNR